tara:strand:- start:228 stop:860 length:633 start_codon:yes stop_codon:yes gene_type:complete
MKEDILRGMIRNQIKSSLKESPMARSSVGTKLGSVEKMAGVKMLKKALGQGSPVQQAAGLLQVIQAISGNNPSVGKQLILMLRKGGISAPVAPVAPVETPAPVEEGLLDFLKKKEKEAPKNKEGGNEPIGVDYDGNYIYESRNFAVAEDVSSALTNRMGRLDKTQAMIMMKKTLANKPASQQAEFVASLVKGLDLKGNITLLIKKIRQKN